MPDREKVIKGLTAIQDEAYDRWVHRQYIEDPLITLIRDNISDALTLLREQEPVEPKRVLGVLPDWYHCGACGVDMLDTGDGYRPKYCPQCGRKVKWNA